MDEEIVEDIEVQEGSTVQPLPEEEKHNIAGTIILCICVVNIVACFFTIFVIKTFKKLRVQFYTGYILHCSIIMSVILILLLIAHYLFPLIPKDYLQAIRCIPAEGGVTILSGQHILYTCMAIDFALDAYDKRKSKKFRRNFNKIVIAVYVYIIFFGAFVFQILCFYRLYSYISTLVELIAVCAYIFTIITVSGVYVYKRIKYPALIDTTTSLKISLSHSLLFLFLISLFVQSYYFTLLSCLLVFSNPLIILMLCCFCDINFRACVIEALRCNCKEYRNAENLENDTISIVYDNRNSQVLEVDPEEDHTCYYYT